MKKLIFLICVTLMGFTTYAQTSDLSAMVDKCSPAVFKITTYDVSGNSKAEGLGFFISSSGDALSNYHLFKGAKKAKIKTGNNKTYLVDNIISWGKEMDLIKFSVKNELNEVFPFVKMNAASPKIGESIFIIGNPLGMDKSVSSGTVSSVRQDDKKGETIMITAAISPANSGSPLLNMNGEALAVTAFFIDNGKSSNFAASVKNLNILDPVNELKFPEEESEFLFPEMKKDIEASKDAENKYNKYDDYNLDEDYNDPSSTFYYIDSKVEFCLEVDSKQQPLNPGKKYNISKSKGSWIYVFVGNNGKTLATDQIIVDIYKKKNKNSTKYEDFVETVKYNITYTWPDTHFKYTFHKAGDYVFKVYSKDNVWINDGYVSIGYK